MLVVVVDFVVLVVVVGAEMEIVVAVVGIAATLDDVVEMA